MNAGALKRAVFLDRDGVVNRTFIRDGKPFAPTRIEDFEILPGVADAVMSFKRAGFLVIIVTNQPDVATGKQTAAGIEAMHKQLRAQVAVDDIFVCYHTDGDGCDCRKPKPGMLHQAEQRHAIALDRSWLVGDRWRDIEAGQVVGCRTVFVDNGYDEPTPKADFVVTALSEAVGPIIERTEIAQRRS